jgi:hypothetical protein
MDESNPYASSEAMELDERREFEPETVAWRDGELLMVRNGASLPNRCLQCNEPTSGFRLHQTILRAHPAIYILVLFGGLLFFLFAKTGRLSFAICPLHRRKRMLAMLKGWLIGLAGVALMPAAAFVPENLVGILVIVGFGLIVTGIIVGAFGSRVLFPGRFDKHFIWLAKVSPAYLATFPDAHQPQ